MSDFRVPASCKIPLVEFFFTALRIVLLISEVEEPFFMTVAIFWTCYVIVQYKMNLGTQAVKLH